MSNDFDSGGQIITPSANNSDLIQGCGNQFRRNRCEINTNGFCIRINNPNLCRVSVYSDNSVAGTGVLTNVAVTNL